MALNNVFREIAQESLKKGGAQLGMVNSLLEESPIIAAMPSEPTTSGLHNLYEDVVSVTGASKVDVDGELADMDVESIIKQTDLSILGGVLFVGEDKANKFGGAKAYFTKKTPLILRKTGEDLEKSIIYNNLRAYAIEKEKARDAGGTGTANFTMLAVTWTPSEITGLYDPSGFGNGLAMDLEPIAGGGLYERTVNGRRINGYGVRLKSYLGIQLANDRYVSAIVNIDLDSATPKPPTGAMIDELLLNARQNTSTVIYMHPRVLIALQELKAAALQFFVGDTNVNRIVAFWNGTPIITSYNFANGTEPTVTI